MVKYILSFGAGIVVGNYLKDNKENSVVIETFKVGDKSKDIGDFQVTLNKILGVEHISNIGVYDKETKNLVVDLFEDTSVLIDESTGEIRKQFVLDFNKIFSKL